MLGTGARASSPPRKVYTQGSLNTTGNALDLAVNGRGFFQVQMPDGTSTYTRDGTFQLDAQGELVTASGYRVQPGITIPAAAQSVTVGNDGTVSVQLAGQSAPVQVGTLQLTDFVNPAGLQPRGEILLTRIRRERFPADGTPGRERARHAPQGSVEKFERQRRRGAGRDDPDAARLRDEFQSDLYGRSDAQHAHHAHVISMPRMSLFARPRTRLLPLLGWPAVALLAVALIAGLAACASPPREPEPTR